MGRRADGTDTRPPYHPPMPLFLLIASCTPPEPPLDRSALLDPEACAECHLEQYEEWRGSMHAYASSGPIFRAMLARGQRETDGALGALCVGCHAPMAVREAATVDGLDLDAVEPALLGVTCFTCHMVDSIAALHNNGLVYAGDLAIRGPIEDPIETPAHASLHSPYTDRRYAESSAMCGACHDLVLGDLHVEATFAEWEATQYSTPEDGLQQTCGNCHMDGRAGRAATVEDVPERRIHSHQFPAIDVPLTDFPGADAMEAAVQHALDPTILPTLNVCEDADGVQIKLVLDNVAAGHSFPSGAAQDRRAWAQVTAWAGDEQVFQTGVVPEGTAVFSVDDPERPTFGNQMYNIDGEKVEMVWEIATLVTSQILGATPDVDVHARYGWSLGGVYPTRVEVRVFLRAHDVDFLQSLISSGDLDASYLDAIPTRELAGGHVVWEGLVEPCGG